MSETMEAGRELEIKIAEMMGWAWRHVGFYWDKGVELYLVPPEGEKTIINTTSGSWEWCDDDPNRRVLFDMPQFSTDIGAAWDVVEHVRELDHVTGFTLDDRGAYGWAASFHYHGYAGHIAETAPLAICRAALSAVHTPEDAPK
jgi:hypothetical protein